MSLYSRLDRIAADVARLDRQLTSVSNHPQSQRTSVEGGSIDFNDDDGNLMAIVGSQDDGGNTINVISGPTPPTPVGFTVDVDHGKFIVHWSGDFDGEALAPSDWSRAEVHASQDPFFVPDRTTARGSIVSAAGGEVTIGVLKGPWTIKMLAWSQAGKMSAPSAPVDVEVPGYGEIVLEEIDAANTEIKNGNSILVNAQDTLGGKLDSAFGQLDGINDDLSDLGEAVAGAVASANGKNTVHFDTRKPKPEDEGVAGDTWFVGQVGRPNDVVEATNLATNPAFGNGTTGWIPSNGNPALAVTTDGRLQITATETRTSFDVDVAELPVVADQWVGVSMFVDAEDESTSYIQWRWRIPGSGYSYNSTDSSVKAKGGVRIFGAFRAPSGVSSVLPRLTFRGSAMTVGSKHWMEEPVFAVADSEAAALAQIAIYFDGDTPSGESDNDPHYRWTGTPHASTSEKYLPATEGLSDKWNVTEQYRFQSGAWVQVELSHTVLSSLDLGKLVVGSAAIKEAVIERLWADVVVQRMSIAEEFIGENAILTGAVTAPKITASEELWAKIAQFVKIRAEHIEADAIDGMVITGPNIRTSATGARVQMDPSGVRVFNDDNDVRTHLSPDGSTFKGEVEAETLVVNGGSELRSADNKLGQGAKLTLGSGVTDPTAPPIVQPFWPGIEFEKPEGGELYGLAYAASKYWTFSNIPNSAEGDALISIDPATGEVVDTIPMTGGFWAAGGVTAIGSELFMLGRKDGASYKYFVRVVSTSGSFIREWEYVDVGWSPTNRLVYKPGIGNDGTNIVIAHCNDGGSLIWRTYNKTTGVQIGSEVNRDDATKSDITGVYVGSGDFGATRVVVAKKSTNTIQVFTTTGAATTDSWYTADSNEQGVVYVDGKFRSLSPGGVINEYADRGTGDGSGDWWATYRWSVDLDDDGFNDYTSRIGPARRFTWPSRARVRFMGAPLPVGVGYISPSVAKKTTTPARTDFRTPSFSVYGGESTAWYNTLPSDWLAGSAPSDTNDFPDAEPSVLVSSSNTFEVKGDGSGRWGPLTFNADGTMSSSAVPDWTPITKFKPGFGPQTWGFVPAYRIWPGGKVEWRGVIVGSVTTTVAAFEVPAAARPPQPVNLVAATSTPGGKDATTRIEFGQLNEPDVMRIYRGSADRTWVSIDGAYYYLE